MPAGRPPLARSNCYLPAMDLADAQTSDGFGTGLARAFAGAILFGLPLLMTMEMWWLGFTMPSWKLALFLVVFFPLLVVLSWHAGFEPTFSWRDDVVDALVAYAVGFVASAAILYLLGLLGPDMSLREIVGKVSLQAVPASIGALLAQSQLGNSHPSDVEEREGRVARYASQLFIMGVGALFLGFNVAPTEEMLVIALRIPPWHAVGLALVSVALMHAFVYGASFRGSSYERHEPAWALFLRFTVVGYAIALLLSAATLWWFGRLDGLGAAAAVRVVTVLAFPCALGAAAARLIL